MNGRGDEITTLTLTELSEALRRGTLSAVECCEAYLKNAFRDAVPVPLTPVEEGAPSTDSLLAYLTVTDGLARECAKKADRLRREGKGGPLCGIPYSVKDNIMVKGVEATCGSRMLQTFVPPYTATACERLFDAGAVLLGKANLDEFAMGSSGERSAFGAAHNPLDRTRSPGGSSSGSAASVAAGSALFSLGTDTGGSARQPAAFCGLVAMKPTYGTVSRYGVAEFASSLDQISPITRTVADNYLVLSAIAGRDRRDMTSLDGVSFPVDDVSTLAERLAEAALPGTRPLRGLRVGVPADFSDFAEETVVRCVHRAASCLSVLGAAVGQADVPSPETALALYLVISAAEASSNFARYDGIKYGGNLEKNQFLGNYSRENDFRKIPSLENPVREEREGEADFITETREACFGTEVKRRIAIGSYALSGALRFSDAGCASPEDAYQRVRTARRALCEQMDELFQTYDLLLLPTTGTVAFPLGAFDRAPRALYGSDRFTVYANLTGCPAVNLPCGGDGTLPCGVTLMGPHRSEVMLYGVAAAMERALAPAVEKEVRGSAI